MELLVYQNPEAMERGINPFDHGPLHTDMWKTEGLKQALDHYGFDAAFGGARRDEEKSRAKERIFSFRTASAWLGPEEPAARACGTSTMPAKQRRKHPHLPDLELDRARYLAIYPSERHIESSRSISARTRPTYGADGMLLMADDRAVSEKMVKCRVRNVRSVSARLAAPR